MQNHVNILSCKEHFHDFALLCFRLYTNLIMYHSLINQPTAHQASIFLGSTQADVERKSSFDDGIQPRTQFEGFLVENDYSGEVHSVAQTLHPSRLALQ